MSRNIEEKIFETSNDIVFWVTLLENIDLSRLKICYLLDVEYLKFSGGYI